MNTFQLIVAIAFGTFFGGVLNAMFGFVLDIANRRNYEKLEEQRMEEVREKSKELANIITGEIEKANPNLAVKPIKNGKGVKVSAKKETPKRKRV